MPDSVAGLAVLVFSLAPGFVFLQRRELFHPGRNYSTLRETSIVVVTSLITLVVAGLLFALVSNWIPGSRSATNALFDQGLEWVKANYRSAFMCGLAILTTSAALAFVAASPPAWFPGMDTAWGKHWRGSRQRISSAWTVAFATNNRTNGPVLVGVELDNGTHLRGVLDHWSTDLDEHCNRSLLLARPLAIRSGDTFEDLEAHYVEVSAAQIKYLTAMYVTKDALQEPVPTEPG